MKKLLTSILAIAIVAVAVTGCSGGAGSSDPKAVLKEFFDKMSKKDIEGAAKLATKDSKSTMDLMKKGMDMAEKMKTETKEEDPTDDFKDVEIGDAKIDGDNATVPFTNKKKNVSFDFPLKKEDGSWKVDFSMSTLMKMGMEQAGKNGEMSPEDMEEMKNMNMDSLKQGVDEMLKKVSPEDMDKMKDMMNDMQKKSDN